MAIEQIWFGTRAVRFENGGNAGAQLEQVNSEADFATRLVGGQSVDNTGAEWQQVLAFLGTEGHGANLGNGVDAADLRVGNGVTAHNLADIAGNGRVIDLTGTLDDADDPVALTGHGRQSAGALGAATTEATGSANRVVFSNDLGLGLINGSGTDSGGTANASRLNDGDSVNVEVRQGRVLGEASFTVKVRDGGSAVVVLDSDGRTVRDTNGSLQGGFVQDASAGELDLGPVAHGTRITVDYDARTISIGGVAFTGDATAFFDAFEAGGAKDLTLGSRLGSQNGWSADDLVLTTGDLEPEPEIAIAATFGGAGSGAVQEDTTLSAAGTLTVSHPEAGKACFVAQSGSAGAYGTFSIGADGGWTYQLGNGLAAVQALKGGEGATDSFLVAALDGSTTTVVIAIAGSDDAATFGGSGTGAVVEDGTLATGGTLTVQDADAGQAAFNPLVEIAGSYGSFSIGAGGAWSYLLDNDAAQALGGGAVFTEEFTVTSLDGSSFVVKVDVAGANDAASLLGDTAGTVREDTTLSVSGTLAVQDADAGEAAMLAQSGTAGLYGSFSIDADGGWTYLLDNDATAVQALVTGGSLADSFAVAAADGTTTTIEIVIEGRDDIASFGGSATGDVEEDGNAFAGGVLTVSDPDAGQEGFVPQAETAGTYGFFTLEADGSWSYRLDNAADHVQALQQGQSVTDSFEVASLGNSIATVAVTIHGAADLASFSGDTYATVREDTETSAAGVVAVNDPDPGDTGIVAQSGVAGAFGSFSIGTDGAWSYLLDNGAAHVQALLTGESHEERFTVESVDGSTTTVTIEVRGRSDLAVFGGMSSGSVREDTTLSAAGTLTVADPDAGQAGFTAQPGSAGAYGTFSIGADGAWSYLLNNAAAGLQALNSSQTMQENFIVTSLDGSTTQVTISVQGLDETFLPAPFTGIGDPNDSPARPAAPTGTYTTYGGGGDSVRGSGSGDWIDGGGGNDTIMAGNGGDAIRGGDGDDRINVAGGNDWADGGLGADSVAGGGGNDILAGGDGADTVSGGNGAATIYGDAGNDSLNGNPLLYGGEGNDSMVGGLSAGDTIYGGSGADTIRGRGGNDLIVGGYGADTIGSGDGADRIAFLSARDTGDLVTDWDSSDVLDFSAFAGTLTFKAAAGQSFTAQNQVAWYQDAGNTLVVVDTDGVLDTAEFVVRLAGLHSIAAADLVL